MLKSSTGFIIWSCQVVVSKTTSSKYVKMEKRLVQHGHTGRAAPAKITVFFSLNAILCMYLNVSSLFFLLDNIAWLYLSRRFFSKSLTPCFQNIVEKCRNATDKANLEIMMSRAQAITSQKSYLCKDGMLNSFKNFKSRDCPERALQETRKCAQSFHKEFRESKGSTSLCRYERNIFLHWLNNNHKSKRRTYNFCTTWWTLPREMPPIFQPKIVTVDSLEILRKTANRLATV